MKRIMSVLVAIAFCISLVGCASGPSVENFDNANYGSYPANYEEIIKNHFKYRLKDYETAQFEFEGEPVQGAVRRGLINGGGYDYGWLGFVLINAKNSYGGYTGFQRYIYMIGNGVKATEYDEFARDAVYFK